jgi:hypothetical protein
VERSTQLKTSQVGQFLSQLSYFVSKLGVFTAIESPDRALSISINGVFQNLVVVEHAVAEGVVDLKEGVPSQALGVVTCY